MVSTRTKIFHQNYLSLLGKRQGGNEAGVRLLWVGMFVLVAVWTSFLTKSIKDPKVVFLLGFGIHELFFLNLGRGISRIQH
jgi:hypothetical protein